MHHATLNDISTPKVSRMESLDENQDISHTVSEDLSRRARIQTYCEKDATLR